MTVATAIRNGRELDAHGIGDAARVRIVCNVGRVVEPNDVIELLSRSEDELYADLGASLLPGARKDLSPADVRRLIDLGRSWLHNASEELRDALCADPRVIAARVAAETDPTALALVLLDVLAAREGWPPPATLSALLFKIGIDKICG
jgi:hypothetical protein